MRITYHESAWRKWGEDTASGDPSQHLATLIMPLGKSRSSSLGAKHRLSEESTSKLSVLMVNLMF